MPPAATASPFRVVHTVCSHDCPDSCGVLVTVNAEGRAVKLQGDPSHPVTQGFLCGKVAKYLDRVYAPDRVIYPLRRKPGAGKGPLSRGREHEAFERGKSRPVAATYYCGSSRRGGWFAARGGPRGTGGCALTTRRYGLYPLRGVPECGFRLVVEPARRSAR